MKNCSDLSQVPMTNICFLPFTSPPQDLAVSVILPKKSRDSEPAGKHRKFKKNVFNDKLVVRVYCLLCLKWINRAVSETESQSGNHNRRLQACVASVASGFHTALICFLRLSHNGGVEFLRNRRVIFLIKAWRLP